MPFRFRYLVFSLALLLGGSFIFFQPDSKVRQQAIAAANAEPEILARQAAPGHDANQRPITSELLNHLNYDALCRESGESARAGLEESRDGGIIQEKGVGPLLKNLSRRSL